MVNILKYIGSCPVCNRKLRPASATVITQTARGALVEADCRNCMTSLMLTIFANVSGSPPREKAARLPGEPDLVTLVGIVTDLTAADARRILHKRAVSVDDVFAVHRHLPAHARGHRVIWRNGTN